MRLMREFTALLMVCILVICGINSPASAQDTSSALQLCTPSTEATKLTAESTAETTVPPDMPASQPTLYIVTTVAPLTSIAFNIAGNRVKIHGLIPEGVDSHTFEPKPSDATFISEADVIFINGLHLEDPTKQLAEANLKQGAEIVELGALTLAPTDWIFDFSFPKDNGDPNPHLWMNPFFALNYAKIIRDTLSNRDPDSATFYATNYDQFAKRITILDQAICNAMATIPSEQRKLLTYHDSFAYFAPRYNVTIIGAIQPSDFTEPSAQEVANLIDQIKAEKVPAIFGSEVFPSKVIDQIGREAGVQYIDTLADDDLPNQTGNRLYHSYLQLMVNDVTTLTTALGGNADLLKIVPTDNINGVDTAVEVSGN